MEGSSGHVVAFYPIRRTKQELTVERAQYHLLLPLGYNFYTYTTGAISGCARVFPVQIAVLSEHPL